MKTTVLLVLWYVSLLAISFAAVTITGYPVYITAPVVVVVEQLLLDILILTKGDYHDKNT